MEPCAYRSYVQVCLKLRITKTCYHLTAAHCSRGRERWWFSQLADGLLLSWYPWEVQSILYLPQLLIKSLGSSEEAAAYSVLEEADRLGDIGMGTSGDALLFCGKAAQVRNNAHQLRCWQEKCLQLNTSLHAHVQALETDMLTEIWFQDTHIIIVSWYCFLFKFLLLAKFCRKHGIILSRKTAKICWLHLKDSIQDAALCFHWPWDNVQICYLNQCYGLQAFVLLNQLTGH